MMIDYPFDFKNLKPLQEAARRDDACDVFVPSDIRAMLGEIERLQRLVGERRAPVQGFSAGIPWSMHLRAYDVYCKKHGKQWALIEGGCRGGFSDDELDELIPGWRTEL